MKLAALGIACVLSAAVSARAAEPPRPAGGPPFPPAPAVRPAPADQHPKVDAAHKPDAPHGRVCFNATETREKITQHHLAEPFRALRAGRLQGEALRAKLCRWKTDSFIYEISVLRRDGKVVRIYMNAQDGQTVGALGDLDRH